MDAPDNAYIIRVSREYRSAVTIESRRNLDL